MGCPAVVRYANTEARHSLSFPLPLELLKGSAGALPATLHSQQLQCLIGSLSSMHYPITKHPRSLPMFVPAIVDKSLCRLLGMVPRRRKCVLALRIIKPEKNASLPAITSGNSL